MCLAPDQERSDEAESGGCGQGDLQTSFVHETNPIPEINQSEPRLARVTSKR